MSRNKVEPNWGTRLAEHIGQLTLLTDSLSPLAKSIRKLIFVVSSIACLPWMKDLLVTMIGS